MPVSSEPWPIWALLILLLLLTVLGLLLFLLWQIHRQPSGKPVSKEPVGAAQNQLSNAPGPGTSSDKAAQDAFSYTVSHDLRAPIRVVEGFTKILKEDYGAQLDRIGNDHLDRVLGAACRMNQMIDALLALSQLSSQPLGQQTVDLSQLAHYIAEDLRRQQPERSVQFHIHPGLTTRGDPTLLRVVLENLLGNAWKYTSKRPDPEIWLMPHSDHPHTYTVRDNGAGFDMRFADRLFGVFQRLHSATDFAGTGVGLASVKRIVQRHGGEIWAQAEVGQGAAFHFSLDPYGQARQGQ
jgi:light-regulated signal transduction histidine kinase (bacteriophytochrome)